MHKIGIIADTRIAPGDDRALPAGLTRALDGVDLIIHAGNIGCERVLRDLEAIAPVEAVAGPLDDPAAFSRSLPATRCLEIGGHRILVSCIPPDPATIAPGSADIVISGNTCKPRITESRTIRLAIDPGSPIQGIGDARQERGTMALLKLKLGKLLFCYIVKI